MKEESGKLVSVAKFMEPLDAQIAKGMLESEGIDCFLVGEQANHMVPLAFRTSLLVKDRDEKMAKELLASAEESGDE